MKTEPVKKVENRINDDAIWRQTIETEVFGSLSNPYGFLNGGYKNVTHKTIAIDSRIQ